MIQTVWWVGESPEAAGECEGVVGVLRALCDCDLDMGTFSFPCWKHLLDPSLMADSVLLFSWDVFPLCGAAQHPLWLEVLLIAVKTNMHVHVHSLLSTDVLRHAHTYNSHVHIEMIRLATQACTHWHHKCTYTNQVWVDIYHQRVYHNQYGSYYSCTI